MSPVLAVARIASRASLLLLLGSPLSSQSTVLKAARMLDVKSGTIVRNPVVVISGERILAVGPDAMIPQGAKVIDLGNVTLLPGLIDAQTHLLQNYSGEVGGDDPNMVLTVTTLGTTKRAPLGAAMGREDLEAGMSPLEVLRAATIGSAELLGWQKRIGTIEPAKYADIIAVPGNPLEDERVLERVSFVMKGGKVVRQ